MASRPKRGETEEDLLEFQQQFLASRDTPSVTVIRASRDGGRERGQTESTTVQRDVVDLQG